MLVGMDANGPALEQLSRAECLRLTGTVPVGRIVYTRQALPAVELVNFALADGDIVIRTSAEGKLAAATRGTVVGQAGAVTGTPEIRGLERVALASWVPGERDHFIRISPAIVNGRRAGGQPQEGTPVRVISERQLAIVLGA